LIGKEKPLKEHLRNAAEKQATKATDALGFKAACRKLYHRLRLAQDADFSCAEVHV
jgi:hypothetical protein